MNHPSTFHRAVADPSLQRYVALRQDVVADEIYEINEMMFGDNIFPIFHFRDFRVFCGYMYIN